MDEETIRREAGEAITSLELDSTVSAVTHHGGNWCIQFSGDYGQFCDQFRNQFERDNNPRVIREKIKKHLLEQITQMRNKGGRRTSKKAFEDEQGRNATELFQEAFTQTTRAIGEAIERTLGITGAGIEAAGEVAETLTANAAEIIRPEPAREPARARPASSAARKSSGDKSAGKAKRSATKKRAVRKSARATSKGSAGPKKKKSSPK